MTTGFRFDLNSCTGCNACELACSTENQLGWGNSWRQVIPFNAQRLPSIPSYHLSLACNHCTEAPCMGACPSLAIERDDQTGAILIEPTHCIGCKYCSWVCPYEAPRFDEPTQVMGKCTWCNPRLADNREPACVEQCPTLALTFGTLQGAESVSGFPKTPARPLIRFEPLAQARQEGPECSWEVPSDIVESFTASRPETRNDISLRTEWPLWLFTLLTSVLVGWMLGSMGDLETPDPSLFLGLAAAATTGSTVHLGKKWRAWRAVANLRHSWLSREVVFFSLFVASSLLSFVFQEWRVMGWAAAISGVLTLFSVDRVYDVVRPPTGHRLHSADTVLTGLLVAALIRGHVPLSLTVMAVKLALYLTRRLRRLRSEQVAHNVNSWVLSGLRVGLGLALPVLLWVLGHEAGAAWAIVGIAVGEILDRAEFYNELVNPSLRRLAAIDLERLRFKAA